MSNLYDAIYRSHQFKKFQLDKLLFVEYTCDPGGPRADIWSHTNYITFVVRGKMTLKTLHQKYHIEEGNCYFVRKGACVIPRFYKEFCDLIIFLPDEFIRGVIEKYRISLQTSDPSENKLVVKLDYNERLKGYYQSLFSYFKSDEPPSFPLLRIKFEELIVNILSNPLNQPMIDYLARLHRHHKISIQEIMESNFCSNLSIADFARLTARSVSTFRREFVQIYGKPPGEWLREKKLAFSRYLLLNSSDSLEDIIFEAGFNNRSHFTRIFKQQYGLSPQQYRMEKTRT